MMDRVEVFGIRINTLTKHDYLSVIQKNLNERRKLVQNSINAALIVETRKNETLRLVINKSDLVNIDGMAVVWALRLLGYSVPERVPCPDLAEDLLALAEKRSYSIFFLGASDDSLNLCVTRLKDRFPSLKIAGYNNGYFTADDEPSIVDMINRADPDILLIGMPSPRKELFVEKYRNILTARYCLGVGGYFDILSGLIARAPLWMQNIGMEWAYRLIQEPRRMWRRYLIGNTRFIFLVLKEKLIKKK